MIINIPGANWRIKGDNPNWVVQYRETKKDGSDGDWVGRYYFASLSYAVDKALEMALMDGEQAVDVPDVPGEVRRAKDALLKAVRKEMCHADGRESAR